MKRSFKILSMVMVAVILLTASVISVSAGQLPDGGQITNCGDSYAYGYTSGVGTSKLYVYCQVGIYQESSGDGMAAAIFPEYSGNCTAYQSIYAWEKTGTTSYSVITSKDFNTTYIEDETYIVQLYTNPYSVDKCTAGHQITIPGYGSFVAGTTVFPD